MRDVKTGGRTRSLVAAADRSSPLRSMAAVFMLALIVRLAFVAVVPGLSLEVSQLRGDEIDYHEIANNLQAGDGFAREWSGGGPDAGEVVPTAFRTPLWPGLLAVVYAVVGPDPVAGRLLVVVLSALAAALLVPLGRRLWSPSVGVLAGVGGAVFPPMWVGSWRLMSEALFTVLVLVVLLLADRFRRSPTKAAAAWLGASLGLAALARPNGILIGVAIMAAMVAMRPRVDLKGALVHAGICAVALVSVIAPWTIRNAVRFGELVPLSTQGGAVLAGYYSPAVLDRSTPYWGGWDYPLVIQQELKRAPDEVTWDRELQARGRSWIADHPGDAARIVWYHVLRYFDLYLDLPQRRVAFEGMPSPWTSVNGIFLLSFWSAGLLAIAGLVRALRAGAIGPFVPALLAYAALAASGILLGAGPRFREPSEPILVLFAAIAAMASVSRPTNAGSAPAAAATGGQRRM